MTLTIAQSGRDSIKKKLLLEAKFKPKLVAFFKKIAAAYVHAPYGSQIIDDTVHDEARNMFFEHYSDVALKFQGSISKQLVAAAKMSELEAKKLSRYIENFIVVNSELRSGYMLETTKKEINKAREETHAQAIETARDSGVTTSMVEENLLASASLSKTFAGRVQSIAITETQFSAEAIKAAEASVLMGITPGTALSRENVVYKEWVSFGDEKVRTAHRIADGQIIQFNEPFVVGGELMMYPSDQSLGASIGNVINCRCSSEIAVDAIEQLRLQGKI